jgi:hypothetical protein
MAKVNKVPVTIQLTEKQYKQIFELSNLVGLSFSETIRLILVESNELTEKLISDFKKQTI